MAVAYVTELRGIAADGGNNPVPLASEPAITVQKVTFTTHVESAAFNAATTMIRIMATASAHYQIGSAPVAVVATDAPLPAMPCYLEMGVTPGHKISFVASDGSF